MTKKKYEPTLELFQEKINEINIEYPVVVEYNDGGMEAYFENGVRFYLKVSFKSITFLKMKWSSSNNESSKEEYSYYIKRLIYTHKIGTAEGFNELYEKFQKVSDELDNISFEHSFEAAVPEENFNGLLKKKNIDDKKEEEHPF